MLNIELPRKLSDFIVLLHFENYSCRSRSRRSSKNIHIHINQHKTLNTLRGLLVQGTEKQQMSRCVFISNTICYNNKTGKIINFISY